MLSYWMLDGFFLIRNRDDYVSWSRGFGRFFASIPDLTDPNRSALVVAMNGGDSNGKTLITDFSSAEMHGISCEEFDIKSIPTSDISGSRQLEIHGETVKNSSKNPESVPLTMYAKAPFSYHCCIMDILNPSNSPSALQEARQKLKFLLDHIADLEGIVSITSLSEFTATQSGTSLEEIFSKAREVEARKLADVIFYVSSLDGDGLYQPMDWPHISVSPITPEHFNNHETVLTRMGLRRCGHNPFPNIIYARVNQEKDRRLQGNEVQEAWDIFKKEYKFIIHNSFDSLYLPDGYDTEPDFQRMFGVNRRPEVQGWGAPEV